MIKIQDLTPEVYYKQSRDFQFIGRLYDIVLNYVKTNIANLHNLPANKNMDEQLLNLLSLTLGFKATKNYNSKQLLAICSALPTILKNKGSIQSLILAANALLSAEGINQPLNYHINPKQGVTLYVAQELDDLTLLNDLLDYLLPAGLSCTINKESQLTNKSDNIFGFEDTVNISIHDERSLSKIDSSTDLSIGAIGNNASILSNISIIPNAASLEKPSTTNNQYKNIPPKQEEK